MRADDKRNLIYLIQTKIIVLWWRHASNKEAGRLVVQHEVDPKTSTLLKKGLKSMVTHSSATVRVQTPHETETTQITTNDKTTDVSDLEKIESLIDIICGTGAAQVAGALFVLMGTLQNSSEPDALAHAAKHIAFTRCGELNLNGMVDAHLAVVESELLSAMKR